MQAHVSMGSSRAGNGAEDAPRHQFDVANTVKDKVWCVDGSAQDNTRTFAAPITKVSHKPALNLVKCSRRGAFQRTQNR